MLILTVDSEAATAPSERSWTLYRTSATVGRSEINDWVLPDPDCHLSKRHCTITYGEGQYWITDTSLNGVFLNGSPDALGRGASAALKDGDRIQIGDYEIRAKVMPDVEEPAAQRARRNTDDPFAAVLAADERPVEDADPFGLGHGGAQRSGAGDLPALPPTQPERPEIVRAQTTPFDPDLDILPSPSSLDLNEDPIFAPIRPGVEAGIVRPSSGFADSGHGGPGSDGIGFEPSPWPASAWTGLAPAPAADPDHLPSPNEAFRPPHPVWESLPEDWDKGEKAESANQRLAIPELRQEAPLRAEGPALPLSATEVPATAARLTAPALPEPPAAGSSGGAVAAFLEAAGLGGMKLSDPEAIELMQTAGACFREMMEGMRQILAARAVMKNEMRLERTVIGSVNNNPLKFLPNSDDAMAALLRPHARGYLPAVDAVREAFHDLKAHELATIAGMQAALRALLKRFDPANLKRRLDRHSLLASILPPARDAKYWAVYEQLYREVAVEAENSFNGLYGREFARAYEDQVKKL